MTGSWRPGLEPGTPSMKLVELARSGVSGELIVAGNTVEIHVYLIDGRLAWATSSSDSHAFIRRLVERHGIAPDTIHAVLQDCRRSRRRLGETLVAWGVASSAQIRDALMSQISEALAATASIGGARWLFLPRRMKYDPTLTFALEELTEVAPAVSDASAAMIGFVLDTIPDACWVGVVAAGRIASQAARQPVDSSAVIIRLAAALDVEVLDSLVVRSSRGSVLGQRLTSRSESVWCSVGPSAKLGVTSLVLASAVHGERVHDPRAASAVWQDRSDPGAAVAPRVFSAIASSDDVVAAFVIGDTGAATGTWRRDTFEDHVGLIHAVRFIVATDIAGALPACTDRLAYDGVSVRAVTADDSVYYGAHVPGTGSTVWLVFRGQAAQGLGWALLQAVARQLSDLSIGGR